MRAWFRALSVIWRWLAVMQCTITKKRDNDSVPWSRWLNLTLKSDGNVLPVQCDTAVGPVPLWPLTPEHTYIFPLDWYHSTFYNSIFEWFTDSLVRHWTHQDPRCWWRSGSCRHYIWHIPHVLTQPHVLNLACFLQRAFSAGGCRPGLGGVVVDEDAVNKWPVFVPTGWPEWPVKGREQLISTDCG